MLRYLIIVSIVVLISINTAPVYAINIGTYQTDSEYGLLDGFKFNWKRKDKTEPFVEVREESSKKEREKEKDDIKKDEYQYTKYMYDGQAFF